MISVSLLGNKVVEFFFGNDTVQISVSAFDHLLENTVIGDLSKVFRDLTEILQGNVAGPVWVEGDKHLVYLISGFVVTWTSGHHIEEFVELDHTTTVLVKLSDHLIDSLSFGLNSKSIDGDLQL